MKTNIFSKNKRVHSGSRNDPENEVKVNKDRQMYGNSTLKKIMAMKEPNNNGSDFEDREDFFMTNKAVVGESNFEHNRAINEARHRERDILRQVDLSTVQSVKNSDMKDRDVRSDEERPSINIMKRDSDNWQN